MDNLNLESLGFALFFKNELHKPKSIFNDLEKELDFLNGVKVELPDVAELPDEIPRLIYRSLNDEYTCQISKSRIDFSLNSEQMEDSIENILSKFDEKIKLIIKYVSNKQTINRFGLVATFFVESNQSVENLQKKYFNQLITDINELSVRFNKPFALKDFKLNNIINIEAGITKETYDQKGNFQSTLGTLIARDINNIVSTDLILNQETLLELYNHVSKNIQINAIKSLM